MKKWIKTWFHSIWKFWSISPEKSNITLLQDSWQLLLCFCARALRLWYLNGIITTTSIVIIDLYILPLLMLSYGIWAISVSYQLSAFPVILFTYFIVRVIFELKQVTDIMLNIFLLGFIAFPAFVIWTGMLYEIETIVVIIGRHRMFLYANFMFEYAYIYTHYTYVKIYVGNIFICGVKVMRTLVPLLLATKCIHAENITNFWIS